MHLKIWASITLILAWDLWVYSYVYLNICNMASLLNKYIWFYHTKAVTLLQYLREPKQGSLREKHSDF